jgi:ferredoxin--NADP+ reductase
MSTPGTPDNPLRVAIIGSGPSGFYAADALQRSDDLTVEIDMFDRLPTPFGLVRGGVAPDHQKIKSVTKVYERIAQKDNFHFYGNVEFGTDLTRQDMLNYYHALIYATGAQTDREMGIPGESLPGSHAATEFVAWYNAHPDYRDLEFDLSVENVAVIGVGNVAMDVARILARSQAELMDTDIADYAYEELANSSIKRIYIIGRRGPAQAAFTNPEVKELGEMEDVDVIVTPDQVKLDELSQAYIDKGEDRVAVKNVDLLTEYASRTPEGRPKQIVFRFLESPTELIGTDHVEAIKLVKNELYLNEKGVLRPRATDQTETLDVGLVFRSIGYVGVPLPDVPFYDRWGTIPNEKGRVLTAHEGGKQVVGDYAVGWIKRGASGIIGTNKPDSGETVESLIEDVKAGKCHTPSRADPAAVQALLKDRGVRYVTFADWLIIDQLELERGEAIGRPRLKFSRIGDMLNALDKRKNTQPAG